MSCSVSCDTSSIYRSHSDRSTAYPVCGFQHAGLASTSAIQIRKLVILAIFTHFPVVKDLA